MRLYLLIIRAFFPLMPPRGVSDFFLCSLRPISLVYTPTIFETKSQNTPKPLTHRNELSAYRILLAYSVDI